MPASSDEIATDLRRRIYTGDLPPGAPLPTVDGLAAEWRTTKVTVERALEMLAVAGLIRKRGRGKAPIVENPQTLWTINPTADYAPGNRESKGGRTTFEAQLAARGETARTVHHVNPEIVAAPAYVARLLGTDQVLHVWGEGWVTSLDADGNPELKEERVVGIYDTWVPADVAEQCPLLAQERGPHNVADWNGGVYSVIERGTGLEITFMRHAPVSATPFEQSDQPLATDEDTARFRFLRPERVDVEYLVALTEEGRALCVDRNVKRLGTVTRDYTVRIR